MPTAASLVLREICGNCTGAPERRKLSRSGHSFEPLSVMPAESAAAPILLHCDNCDPACVFSERGANKWNRVARIRRRGVVTSRRMNGVKRGTMQIGSGLPQIFLGLSSLARPDSPGASSQDGRPIGRAQV